MKTMMGQITNAKKGKPKLSVQVHVRGTKGPRRPATQAERALRERAERLGYKLSRRGSEYNLTRPDGSGFGGDLDHINWWLNVEEHKLPVQICSPCGMPLFKINDPDAADAEAESKS
jgi:hypothetical protein